MVLLVLEMKKATNAFVPKVNVFTTLLLNNN